VDSEPRLRRHAPALSVFAVGLMITVVAAVFHMNGTERMQRAELQSITEDVAHDITRSIEEAETRVMALRAFFESSEFVSEMEFERFSTRLGASPGLAVVGYAVWVPAGALHSFEQDAISDRSWFRVQRLDDEVSEVDQHLIVWYATQYEILPHFLGLDLTADAVRSESLSTLEDHVTASRPTGIPGDRDGGNIDIYASVGGDSDESGVVFATVRLDEVLTESVERIGGGRLTASLTPADLESAEGATDIQGEVATRSGAWTLTVGSTSSEAEVWERALIVLFIGVVGSALVGFAVALASRSREKERQIATLTRVAADKDLFLASVSHELRTPLTSFLGLTSVVVDDWDSLAESDRREFIMMAHDQAIELSYLIEDLLTVGRMKAGALSYSTDVVSIGDEVARVVRAIDTKKRIEVRLAPVASEVSGDTLRVRQILRNLIVNGVRYGESFVEISSCRNGRRVEINVVSDGPPIAEERREHLFDPYQGRPGAAGTPGSIGLGLHISRNLAIGMGGELLYARRDRTNQFCLSLPSAEEPTPPFSRSASLVEKASQ